MTTTRMTWTLAVAISMIAPSALALDMGSLTKKAAGGAATAARDKAAKK